MYCSRQRMPRHRKSTEVTVFRQSYMTQRPSLFTLISYCAIVFSFAIMFADLVGLLHAMVFMVLLLVGSVIWNNIPLQLSRPGLLKLFCSATHFKIVFFLGDLLMDSLDVNDTCKRPISLQKHIRLVCQVHLFRDPKIIFPIVWEALIWTGSPAEG